MSVVIPTHNRPSELTRCLEAIASLDVPRPGFEVIVVDDGGEASPDAVVSSLRDRIDVVFVKQPHAGPAAARNAGAMRAEGQYVAFLDDDCVPAKNWLHALMTRITATPGHAIGGRTLNALPDNVYSSASQLLIDYLYAYHNVDRRQASFFASNNLALPRDGFLAIGGFDAAFPSAAGEDRDLCDRWRRHGYRMTYAPEVVIYHAHALTLRGFWRQHFNYGRGAFSFRRAHAQRTDGRIHLEPWEFYVNLVRFPFSRARRGHASLLCAALLVSQLANAAGFLWEGTRKARARATASRTVKE